jgi:hypothetical protein
MKMNRIVDTGVVDMRRNHLTQPLAARSGTVDRHSQSWRCHHRVLGGLHVFCLQHGLSVLLHTRSATSCQFYARYRKGQSFIQLHAPKHLNGTPTVTHASAATQPACVLG